MSRFIKGLVLLALVGGACLITPHAWAQDAAEAPSYITQNTGDIVWLLLTGVLVMLMQAGFAMVETGLTRAKNAINVCAKNFLDFCVGCLLYWAIGYCLMYGYGEGSKYIGWDTSLIFMKNLAVSGADGADNFKNSADWFFQMVFCATAATIISGAMAERTKLISYIFVTGIVTGLIYPIAGGWIWGGGWLGAMGMRDFAGSTVVHSMGGWCALAGAFWVGPRLGKYNADGSSNAIPGHNIVMATLGVFLLWFGWYGFNPGSTLVQNDSVAYIAVTTSLAAAAGGLAGLFVSWIMAGKPDLTMGLNGCLAGLVGITAGCASVEPWAAAVIGLIAGVLVYFSVLFIDKVLKIDDPVGAISVHGVCGAWGTLAIGIFGSHAVDAAIWGDDGSIANGLLYGGGVGQLWVQCVGVFAVFVFGVILASALMLVLKFTIGLRVSDEEQIEGLDLGEHDMSAYPDFQQTYIKSYHAREM